MVFFAALWDALEIAVEGAGTVIVAAANKVAYLIWDGTSITVVGAIILAVLGISLVVLVFELITGFISKITGKKE